MVESAGLDLNDLAGASLVFTHPTGKDEYSTNVQSKILLRDGRHFEHSIKVSW